MRVDIHSKGFSVTDAIRQHVLRRLGFALDRFQDVVAVTVCLGDVNGPKGGADKFCRVAAEIGSRTAVVAEIQPDLYVAISRAAHRLALKVAREVERANRCVPPRSRAAYGGAA